MATFSILSIDGGGSRGVIPATLLDCISKDLNKHPMELFDLVAGTSTGGIIGIGLAARKQTHTLVDLYLTQSKKIFYDTGWDDLRDGFGKNLGADYSNDKLKKILEEQFGTLTLGDVHTDHQGKKILMVASFDLSPQDNGKAVNFRPVVYNSGFLKHKNERLVDIALRTSAGPTYFPIYQQKYIDGGVAMNHPAMAAVAFAINKQVETEDLNYRYPDGLKKGLGLEARDIRVLSLGCGTSNRNFIAPDKVKKGDWGNLQWVKYLPDLLTESNVQAADYYVRQVMDRNDYKRIQLEFDAADAPAVLKGSVLGLDVKSPTLLRAMHEYAKQVYALRKQEILSFLGF
ncbi:MAG: patatin-like phospholipase family protein [Cyclobacteriaceae bacterium]|nr:patatin-like phospholipase family protein [Cyclobacteriaceae bacterium]